MPGAHGDGLCPGLTGMVCAPGPTGMVCERGATWMVCARGPTGMVRTLNLFQNSLNSSGVRAGKGGITKEREWTFEVQIT